MIPTNVLTAETMETNDNNDRHFGDCYVFSKTIGNGNFSLVRKVRHKFSRSMYAAKIVKLPAINNDDSGEDYEDILDMMRGEVAVMRRLKHPNLLQFVDVFYTKAQVILLIELAEHGDLHEYFQKIEEQLPEETARSFCLQIASAINYIHSMKIAHRDLKPENVLLFKQKQETTFTLKLCDFGLAEECTTLDGFTRVCGSPSYVAPEILEFKPYGLAVDVWSMGVLFYLIVCKYVPFDDIDMSRKFELIMTSRLEFPDNEWSNVSKEAKRLISLMLEKNPRIRIKAGAVLHNRWFRRTPPVMNILKKMNSLSFKSAASVLLHFNQAWKNNRREDAVLSKRLVENTFLFSKNCSNKNVDNSNNNSNYNSNNINNNNENCTRQPPSHQALERCKATERKHRSQSDLPATCRRQCDTDVISNQENKLPPISHTNSILRASSDERIRESRSRRKP